MKELFCVQTFVCNNLQHSLSTSSRPAYLPARPTHRHAAPAGGVDAEVEEMFETLTIAEVREVRRGGGRARAFFSIDRAQKKLRFSTNACAHAPPSSLSQVATKTEAEVEDARRQLCALVGDSYR